MERLLSLGQGSQEQRFGFPGLVAGPLGVHFSPVEVMEDWFSR